MNAETILSLSLRAKQYAGRNLNEAQTKTALIQPFIEALGYDVSNPFEVIAEFTADQGTKRGEKIDYAIIKDNAPIILIECKPCGAALDEGKCSQLRRYFQAAPDAKIGILTDGTRYLFFSDRKRENIMDDRPFMEINLLNFNERHLPELQRLCREGLDIDGVLKSADRLQYFHELMREISQEMENPSEEFARFFCSRVCRQKKLTAKALEVLEPIFRQAMEAYLDDRINRRLEDSKSSPKGISAATAPDDGIITTNTETWGLVIVRTLLHEVVDSARICMRDQKSYCSILLDDNNRKTICRFYNFAEWQPEQPNIGDNAHVVIHNGKPGGERFLLQYVDDLYPLKEHFVAAVKALLKA